MATKTDGRKNNRFVKKVAPVAPVAEVVKVQTPEERIAELEATVAQQKEALEKKGAIPGWLITTPNPFYNGKTAGIQFKAGRGFIASRDENAEKKAKMLCDDFGYDRRFVEDFTSDPEMAEEVGGNLTEILLGSQVR